MIHSTNGGPVALYDTSGGRVFGGGSAPLPSPPRTDPSLLTGGMKAVTTENHRATLPETVGAEGLTTIAPSLFKTPTTGIRVWIGGASGANEAALRIRGVTYRLTVNGDAVFDVGEGGAITDPLDEAIFAEAGDDCAFTRYVPPGQTAHSAKMPLQGGARMAGRRHLTAAPIPGHSAYASAPYALIGRTLPGFRSLIAYGDSGLATDWARSTASWAGMGWTDAGAWGQQIATPDVDASGKLVRSPWDIALWVMGSNNTGSAQPETFNKAIQSMYRFADAGVKVAQATFAPRSTSTDAWETVESQRQRDIEWRDEWNTWVRDGSPVNLDRTWAATGTPGALRAGDPGHMCALPPFDRELGVSAINSHGETVWAGGKLTSDGVHYADGGNELARTQFRAWVQARMTEGHM